MIPHEMKRRGQLSMEAFTTIVVMLLLYTTVIFMTVSRDSELRAKSETLGKRDVCIAVQDAISHVAAGGQGTELTFQTPAEYSITIVGNYMEIGDINPQSCTLPIEMDYTILDGGEIRLINADRTMTIENV
jgi:hypothetical protein